jgi:excisionase family DNA binding protein
MARPRAAVVTLRPQSERPWITVKEAAAYLGVGVDAIYEACAKKGLRHLKVGRSTLRLKIEWIEQWAERRAVGQE